MKIWMVRLSTDNGIFDRCIAASVIAIGWARLGNLTAYNSRDSLDAAISVRYPTLTGRRKSSCARTLHLFSTAITTDDIIITYHSRQRVYAVGTVNGNYRYDPFFDSNCPNLLPVTWLPTRVSRDELPARLTNIFSSGLPLFQLPDKALDVVEKASIGTPRSQFHSKFPLLRILLYVSTLLKHTLLRIHIAIKVAEPYTFVLAAVGLLITAITMLLDLDDRTAERQFRAWQVIIDASQSSSSSDNGTSSLTPTEEYSTGSTPSSAGYDFTSSSVYRESVEYLTRSFDGWFCYDWVSSASKALTGNHYRRCIFPKKDSEDLKGLAFVAADFSESELAGAAMAKSNYSKAVFHRADLTGANLRESTLVGADFSEGILIGANLSESVIDEAIFVDANLDAASFSNSRLRDASLRGASMELTDISGADLAGVRHLTQAQLDLACADPDNPPKNLGVLFWKKENQCETWQELRVKSESRCSEYDRNDYAYSQSLRKEVVEHLGKTFSPYTNRCFGPEAPLHLEHIVSMSEAHDSGLCAATVDVRRAFAEDVSNTVLIEPRVNMMKGARDAAEWLPEYNRCWFAGKVVEVRKKYGLTIDKAEANELERILQSCPSTELEVPVC